MRLLLDTHALLWWFTADPRLSAAAAAVIADEANAVYVSAASAWAIATKQMSPALTR
jgi:PIN domain nuclease of toxin-antitoxin system